jgi:hypothetical protein
MANTLRCLIFTPYNGTGTTNDPYRPALNDKYGCGFGDVTGQLSEKIKVDPNVYLVSVDIDQTLLDTIRADGSFAVLSVQDLTTFSDGKISPSDQTAVQTYLKSNGLDATKVDTLISKTTLDAAQLITETQKMITGIAKAVVANVDVLEG